MIKKCENCGHTTYGTDEEVIDRDLLLGMFAEAENYALHGRGMTVNIHLPEDVSLQAGLARVFVDMINTVSDQKIAIRALKAEKNGRG